MRGRLAGAALGEGVLPLGFALAAVGACMAALRFASSRPGIGLVLCAAAAGGLLLLLRPAWALPIFAALSWSAVDYSGAVGGLPTVFEAGSLALVGFGAYRVLRGRASAEAPLAVAAFIAVPVVVATLLAPVIAAKPADLLKDAVFILVGAWCARGTADVERVLTAIAVTGGVLGAGAIFSVVSHPTALFPVLSDGPGATPRAAGPFGEPNFFALSLAATMPASLLLVARGGARRTVGVLALALAAGGILAAGSRGGLIAGGVGIVAMAWISRDRATRALTTLLVAGALVVLGGGAATGVASFKERSVSGRVTENRIALAMFADHPLTGVGPGVFERIYRDYSRRIGNDPRPVRAAHDLYLQIAAEQGLVGIACWLAAALLVASEARRRGALRTLTGRTALVCLATYLAGSLFLHGSQLRLPFLLVGLILACGSAQPRARWRGGP